MYIAVSIAINVLSFLFALLRTILAILTLHNHGKDWPSLPFISPILWLDWVAIFAISGHIHPFLSLISFIATFLCWTTCFWLTIGYGQLGYGTRQYKILNIPYLCSNSGINFETDPRRGNFVGLHVTQFIISTVCLVFALPTIFRGQQAASAILTSEGKWLLIMGFLLPCWIGVVIGAADHNYPYLLLNQGNCFASFVSGWVGYGDLPEVGWIVKASTMIGLNN